MTYPEPVNMTSLTHMFQYANTVTDNVFVILLLIVAYAIPLSYMLLRGHEWHKAGMAAGFFVTITAALLRAAQILTVDRYLWFAVATILIPLVYALLHDSSN